MRFGEMLRRLRESAGMSRTALREAISGHGFEKPPSVDTIKDLERGRRGKPQARNIRMYLSVFDQLSCFT